MNPTIQAALKDLTNDNLYEKVGNLLASITGNYTDNNQTALLFIYHNKIYPTQQEHTQGCGACRGRVYNRVKDWYTKNTSNKNDI